MNLGVAYFLGTEEMTRHHSCKKESVWGQICVLEMLLWPQRVLFR